MSRVIGLVLDDAKGFALAVLNLRTLSIVRINPKIRNISIL